MRQWELVAVGIPCQSGQLNREAEQLAVVTDAPDPHVLVLRTGVAEPLEAEDPVRAQALAPGETIMPRDLRTALLPTVAPATDATDWPQRLAAAVSAALARGATDLHERLRTRFDQVLLETALEHTDGHRQKAAERLGLGRNTLTRKLGSTRSPRKRP